MSIVASSQIFFGGTRFSQIEFCVFKNPTFCMFFLQISVLFLPFQFSLSILIFVLGRTLHALTMSDFRSTACKCVTLMIPNYFVSLKVTHGVTSENFAYVLNGWPPFLTSESHEPNLNAVGGESHHIQILGRTYFT